MKKQILNGSYRTKKNLPAGGLRGIAQSLISVGIPTVIETSVREEYSYYKKQENKSLFRTVTNDLKIKL